MMKASLLTVTLTLVLASFQAQAACSTRSVRGVWLFDYQGVDIATSSTCAAVGTLTFTGTTARVTAMRESCNGSVNNLAGEGSFSLARSCTGQATVALSSGTTVRFDFNVQDDDDDDDDVSDAGDEMRLAVSAGARTFAGTASRRDD